MMMSKKIIRKLARQFGVYRYLLSTSFRQRFVYRSGVWMDILHGCLFIFLQGSLWTALIATGYTDNTLQEMISYVIINTLVGYLTSFHATGLMTRRVEDGSIASDLILPVSFKWKIFFENIGGNIFDFCFSGIATLVTALILYGASGPAGVLQFAAFLLSVLLGILISYQILYLFSLSAFWVIKPWYIPVLAGALTKLFGGGVIPIWLYPDWLKALSGILPFRFITYEPIQIFLGNHQGMDILRCLLMQGIVFAVLVLIEKFLWSKASHKVFVQGG
jgi:ABC-2 type transport system permease protein